MKKRRSFWEDAEETFEDEAVDTVEVEETEEEVCEETEEEYGVVEQTPEASDIPGTNLVLDEEVSELAAKLGEEAELDAEALSALVDDTAGAEMTAQFGKPFVSAPTEDGYETELLEEGQDSELYDPNEDIFETAEAGTEETEEETTEEEVEEDDEIVLDDEEEELDDEGGLE